MKVTSSVSVVATEMRDFMASILAKLPSAVNSEVQCEEVADRAVGAPRPRSLSCPHDFAIWQGEDIPTAQGRSIGFAHGQLAPLPHLLQAPRL